MQHVERICGLRQMNPRQRPPRAADQIEIASGPFDQPRNFRQFGLGDAARTHRIAARAVGQPDDAELAGRCLAALAVGDIHQFERAAADIGQNAVGIGNAAEQTGGGEIGFLLASQGKDAHARQSLAQGRDELRSVGGVAHGGCAEHLERSSRHGTCDGAVAFHHHQRLFDAFIIQPPGRGQAAAKTQYGLFIENRRGIPAPPLEHHQTDGVRAKIDDRAAGQRVFD